MKALRTADGKVEVADVPLPPDASEALVRVVLSGICNTDLEIARGYAGFSGTLGHEFVGVVKRADDRPELVGKRVVGEINVGCGVCELCIAGDARHCAKRTVLGIHGRDGAHAEYLQLPSKNLFPLPDSVSNESAVFIEPLAAAYGIFEQVDIGKDTAIAVIGDGKLGILCARVAALKADRVTIIGKHPEKLFNAQDEKITGRLVSELKPDDTRAFDIVIEASGSESGFATALDLVKPRGKIVLKSTFHGSPTWEASRVVVDEITIVGSRCGRFAPAIELLASGQVTVEDLVSDRFPLAEAAQAMHRAAEPGVLKVLLFNGNTISSEYIQKFVKSY
jgi:threonine dehydrogenase-like Zn-dependent dehydrogenase